MASSLIFDPENLFPLLHEPSRTSGVGQAHSGHTYAEAQAHSGHTYAEAQAHSASVDAHLGMAVAKIEAELLGVRGEVVPGAAFDVQAWIGLPAKSLLTPYTELRLMLDRLNLAVGDSVVDLGAGYSRMGFIIARHHRGVSFFGYELMEARVLESRRAFTKFMPKLAARCESEIRFEIQDLSVADFRPRAADVYFLYDFGSRVAIQKTLQDLREISLARKIRVVGRGRASRDAIERDHPWLSQVHEPRHFEHYSIYQNRE